MGSKKCDNCEFCFCGMCIVYFGSWLLQLSLIGAYEGGPQMRQAPPAPPGKSTAGHSESRLLQAETRLALSSHFSLSLAPVFRHLFPLSRPLLPPLLAPFSPPHSFTCWFTHALRLASGRFHFCIIDYVITGLLSIHKRVTVTYHVELICQ